MQFCAHLLPSLNSAAPPASVSGLDFPPSPMLHCSVGSEYNTHLMSGACLAQVSEKARSTLYIYMHTRMPEQNPFLRFRPWGRDSATLAALTRHCAGRIAARHVATQELIERRMPNRRVRMVRRTCRSTDTTRQRDFSCEVQPPLSQPYPANAVDFGCICSYIVLKARI